MTSFTRILPALVHIQTHLDRHLSLDLLAQEVRLSKFHFHQLFRRATGETPRSYVERLRLEWAALQLRIRRAAVVDVAFECGYRNHETFSRAFRARFRMSPRDYRQEWFRREQNHRRRQFQRTPHVAERGQLSATRVVGLSRMLVAFIRHLGPYERVPPEHFARLSTWTRRRGGGAPLFLGIAHDAPGITPDDKLRFDCCVQVPARFDAERDIGCQRTPGGDYAVTEYVGSWDMAPAYGAIIDRLQNDPSLDIIGLPAIEFYRTSRAGDRDGLAQVSIAIPVRSRRP